MSSTPSVQFAGNCECGKPKCHCDPCASAEQEVKPAFHFSGRHDLLATYQHTRIDMAIARLERRDDAEIAARQDAVLWALELGGGWPR